MAKKKGGSNKTAAIKDYIASNPNAGPRDVSTALKEKGLDVTPQYVSTIKSKLGLGGGKRRRGRPGRPAGASAATAGRKAPSSVVYENLVEAKKFVQSIGDVERARRALDAYANLQ